MREATKKKLKKIANVLYVKFAEIPKKAGDFLLNFIRGNGAKKEGS